MKARGAGRGIGNMPRLNGRNGEKVCAFSPLTNVLVYVKKEWQ